MEKGKEPKTVEEIVQDFKHRHAALVKALTTDVEMFVEACKKGALTEEEGALNDKECNLCLFGMPDGSWKVAPPSLMVPSLIPEPSVGINHGGFSENRSDWLYLVAIHADCWLVSLASFFAAGLNLNERKVVLSRTCEMPTIYETVAREFPRKALDGADVAEKSGRVQTCAKEVQIREQANKDECRVCRGKDFSPFWIACNVCGAWFHGKCLKVSEAKGRSMKFYYCNSLCKEKAKTKGKASLCKEKGKGNA